MLHRKLFLGGFLVCEIICSAASHSRSIEPQVVAILPPEKTFFFGTRQWPLKVEPHLLHFMENYTEENGYVYLPKISYHTGLLVTDLLHLLHRLESEDARHHQEFKDELIERIGSLENGELLEAFYATHHLKISALKEAIKKAIRERSFLGKKKIKVSNILLHLQHSRPEIMFLHWAEPLQNCTMQEGVIDVTAFPRSTIEFILTQLDLVNETIVTRGNEDSVSKKIKAHIKKLEGNDLVKLFNASRVLHISTIHWLAEEALRELEQPTSITAQNLLDLPTDTRNTFLKETIRKLFEIRTRLVDNGIASGTLHVPPDGSLVLAGCCYDCTMIALTTESTHRQSFVGHERPVTAICITSDNQTLVSGSDDGTVRVWDRQGEQRAAYSHPQPVSTLCLSPDGKTIVASFDDGIMLIWNFPDAPNLISGNALATARDLSGTKTWEADPAWLAKEQGHSKITATCVSSTGKIIITGTEDGVVRIWDMNGRLKAVCHCALKKKILAVSTTPDDILKVSTSPDDTVMAVTGDGMVLMWEQSTHFVRGVYPYIEGLSLIDFFVAKEGAQVPTLVQCEVSPNGSLGATGVHAAYIAPNGSIVILGTNKGTVNIWDIINTTACRVCRGHEGCINSVSMSPDMTSIISTAEDGTVRIWSKDGQLLAICDHDDDQEATKAVHVTGNGKIVANSDDGSIYAWNIQKNIQWNFNFGTVRSYIAQASSNQVRGIWSLLQRHSKEYGIADQEECWEEIQRLIARSTSRTSSRT